MLALFLLQRGPLIGFGFCLLMVGLVLRGFARDQRRADALRKQHHLDERKVVTAEPAAPTHLEKHLGRYANGVCLAGLIVVGFGLTR